MRSTGPRYDATVFTGLSAAGQRSTEPMAARAYTPDSGIATLTDGGARFGRGVPPASWGLLTIVTTIGGLSPCMWP